MSKKNKNIFILITLLSLIISVSCIWNADLLVDNFPNQSIVDPNNYLIRNDEYKHIEKTIEKLNGKNHIKTFVYMFSAMEDSLENNLEKLAEQIAYKISGGDLELDKNTLIIIMGIEARKNTIRTGKLVKDLITDSWLKSYLDLIKENLRNRQYTSAIDELLDNIFHRVSGTNYIEQKWEFIIYWGLVIGVIAFFVYIIYDYWIDRKTVSRLDRIKEITKKNISRDAFIDENCAICLEEFSKEELDKLKNMRNGNSNTDEDIKKEQEAAINESQFKQENELINMVEEKENEIRNRKSPLNNQKENANLLNEENSSENKSNNFIAKLNCGHIFHSECIDNWMSKKENCPLCKKRLEDEPGNSNKASDSQNTQNTQNNSNTYSSTERTNLNSNTYAHSSLAEELINIQTHYYPRINNYRFNYINNDFSYSSRTNFNSDKFKKFSKSSKSGGASSSW